jgi:hypothetical protein
MYLGYAADAGGPLRKSSLPRRIRKLLRGNHAERAPALPACPADYREIPRSRSLFEHRIRHSCSQSDQSLAAGVRATPPGIAVFSAVPGSRRVVYFAHKNKV